MLRLGLDVQLLLEQQLLPLTLELLLLLVSLVKEPVLDLLDVGLWVTLLLQPEVGDPPRLFVDEGLETALLLDHLLMDLFLADVVVEPLLPYLTHNLIY